MSKKFLLPAIGALFAVLVLGGEVYYINRLRDVAAPDQEAIRVVSPQPNEKITSPLTVRGEARGNWFFEGSFPVYLVDGPEGTGEEMTSAVAQAQDEWMTTEFVPFEATLIFAQPETSDGTLILAKDNPSGLPAHDAQFTVPVRFAPFEEAPPEPW